MMATWRRTLLLLAACGLSNAAVAFDRCGSLTNAYGPFDYWSDKDQIGIVIRIHFTPGVETLTRTATGSFGGDIDYTLRAIPNHPRALMTMMRLGEKLKTSQPPGAHYSVECYFDRAMRFRPSDGMVRMVYANYLSKNGKNKEALEQLEFALNVSGDNANLFYNVGLAYFELKDFDKALASAHKAYSLGFELPGLRHKLERAGKWREAPPPKVESADTLATPDTAPATAPVAEPVPEPMPMPDGAR